MIAYPPLATGAASHAKEHLMRAKDDSLDWYDATEEAVKAANIAMAEIGSSIPYNADSVAQLQAIKEAVANALCVTVCDDFQRNWPDEVELALSLGRDFIGQTSDTGRIVSWGPEEGPFRPFVIHGIE